MRFVFVFFGREYYRFYVAAKCGSRFMNKNNKKYGN